MQCWFENALQVSSGQQRRSSGSGAKSPPNKYKVTCHHTDSWVLRHLFSYWFLQWWDEQFVANNNIVETNKLKGISAKTLPCVFHSCSHSKWFVQHEILPTKSYLCPALKFQWWLTNRESSALATQPKESSQFRDERRDAKSCRFGIGCPLIVAMFPVWERTVTEWALCLLASLWKSTIRTELSILIFPASMKRNLTYSKLRKV